MTTGDVYTVTLTLMTETVFLVNYYGRYKGLDDSDWVRIGAALCVSLAVILSFVLFLDFYLAEAEAALKWLS